MQPDNKIEMRKFGFMMGGVISCLFGLLLPWLFGYRYPVWPWFGAGVFWLTAMLAPVLLNPIHGAWLRIGHVLAWINTRIILGLMFFTVFFVVSLGMMLIGRDPMSRKLDKNADSYRVASRQRDRNHLEKPF